MSDEALPAPSAPRLRRPTWRDPRLVVGLLLVAASVALGAWVVSGADRTVPVYAAAGTLTPGEPVGPDSLRVVDVNLGDQQDAYLLAEAGLPEGRVALRVVDEGELVAASALGDAAAVDVRSVAVPVDSGLSERIHPGAAVDLWFVPAPGRDGDAADPAPVVSDVVVEQVDVAESGLVVSDQGTLHVLVRDVDLPAVLAALGADGSVAVVPVAS
ncbi:SAF domain-containing protein [Isoptericola jiangsuensis]|uniref:SAF domain-containing protein n=1 Tax=Isoptericola jiangsuensis TaxID=548579 RepID=A0A2A9F0J0_9MICO|nr:SAF domain-containing protein [Isoptericola jiangsuensis]PFG44020.1 SAF domain-containing protein [Isoptericola jiangsuensis]